MWRKQFVNGIILENPILMLMIGLCPVLACSATAAGAFGMGMAATFVLVCSNVMISLIRKTVPPEIRIPIFIIIIATFVTAIDYAMQAWLPALSASLGVFVPLIVVNCIILGRAEAFAFRNGIWLSFWDGLGMGLGFTLAIVILGVIREILGAGTLFGSKAFLSNPSTLMILPPGAFIAIGVLISVWKIIAGKKKKADASPCEHCGMSVMCHPAEPGACEVAEKLEPGTEKPR